MGGGEQRGDRHGLRVGVVHGGGSDADVGYQYRRAIPRRQSLSADTETESNTREACRQCRLDRGFIYSSG